MEEEKEEEEVEGERERDVHALTYVLSIEIALTVTVVWREAGRGEKGGRGSDTWRRQGVPTGAGGD